MRKKFPGARFLQACAFTVAAALVVCAAGTASAARAPQWTVTTLAPTSGTGSTLGRAINNRGDVAGWMSIMSPGFFQQHSFLWQSGTMMDLGLPAGTTFIQANAINDRGTIVGNDNRGSAYIWQDGVWNALGFQGTPASINKFGAIVGNYRDGDVQRSFFYSDGALLTIPGLAPGPTSVGSVNDKGVAVGASQLPDFSLHAIVYQDGITRDIGTLGGTFSAATAINNHGVVVGSSTDASNSGLLPFIYDDAGMRVLFSVPGLQGQANAINERGAVVGTMGPRAFLWEDGAVTWLDEIPAMAATGLTFLQPRAINDRGWITGFGTRVVNGASTQVAFVLTPK